MTDSQQIINPDTAPRWTTFSSYREMLVMVAYVLSCVTYFLSWHFPSSEPVMRYVIGFTVLASIKWTQWDWSKAALILFLFISLVARRLLVVWIIFALVYQIDYLQIPIRKLAKTGAIVFLILIFFQLEMVLLSFVENEEWYTLKVTRTLYDCGTGNPNRAGLLVYFFLLNLYIIFKDNRRCAFIILSLTLSAIAYYYTGSRTGFFGIILVTATALAYWNGLIRNWMKWFIAIIPILCFAATFYMALNMEDNGDVNEAASGRLYYIVTLTKEYTTREWIVGAPRETDDPLDSTYLDIITKGGILLASFMSLSFAVSIIRRFKTTVPYLPFILALFASGLTETYFTSANGVSIILWVFILQSICNYKPNLN